MHPVQFSSLAVYMGNQPSLFAVLRQANTSTGQMARQNPHALHMSSVTATSHLPAGPRAALFSGLNSGMALSLRHQREHDRLGAGDVGAREPFGAGGVTGRDRVEDRPLLATRVAQPGLRPAQA